MGPSLSSHSTSSVSAFCQSLWECFGNQVNSINDFLFVQELWTCYKELRHICLPWCCPSLTKPVSTVPQHIYLIINSAVSFLVLPYLPTVIVLIALLPQWNIKLNLLKLQTLEPPENMKIIFQTKEESHAPPYGHKVLQVQSFYFTSQGSIPYKWFQWRYQIHLLFKTLCWRTQVSLLCA